MRNLSLFFVLAVFAWFNANAQSGGETDSVNKTVTVTYVANAGFLIQVDDKKILVDALFKNEKSQYYDSPSKETIQKIVDGQGIFSGIDLLATSHEHIDNFDEKLTTSFLENNPSAKLIGCDASVDLLKKDGQYKNVESQIVDFNPAKLTYHDTILNGIGVRVLGLSHGPYFISDPLTGQKTNIYKFAKHVGFIFNIGGVNIFHCGDSNSNAIDEYKSFRLDQEHIDIAFLGRGFLYQPKGQGVEIMKRYIQAKNYVIMQIQHEDNDYYINVANVVKDELPNVKVFVKPLESKQYQINSNLLTFQNQ